MDGAEMCIAGFFHNHTSKVSIQVHTSIISKKKPLEEMDFNLKHEQHFDFKYKEVNLFWFVDRVIKLNSIAAFLGEKKVKGDF